jgi:hypothetical protein
LFDLALIRPSGIPQQVRDKLFSHRKERYGRRKNEFSKFKEWDYRYSFRPKQGQNTLKIRKQSLNVYLLLILFLKP